LRFLQFFRKSSASFPPTHRREIPPHPKGPLSVYLEKGMPCFDDFFAFAHTHAVPAKKQDAVYADSISKDFEG